VLGADAQQILKFSDSLAWKSNSTKSRKSDSTLRRQCGLDFRAIIFPMVQRRGFHGDDSVSDARPTTTRVPWSSDGDRCGLAIPTTNHKDVIALIVSNGNLLTYQPIRPMALIHQQRTV